MLNSLLFRPVAYACASFSLYAFACVCARLSSLKHSSAVSIGLAFVVVSSFFQLDCSCSIIVLKVYLPDFQ